MNSNESNNNLTISIGFYSLLICLLFFIFKYIHLNYILSAFLIIPSIYYYHSLVVPVFSFKKITKQYFLNENGEYQAVGILMTVCDDFNENAANTLLKQDYEDYHIFILDDSKIDSQQTSITEWCEIHNDKCTRITRTTSRGYKAGNLNDADKKISAKYELFLIIDSDQHLPQNYLVKIVNRLKSESDLTFIQAIHKGVTKNVSLFSKINSCSIEPKWKYQLAYKNIFGIPTVLGHGFLIKRTALQKVGGHPEIVSEDLALSMKLYSSGYWGAICTNIQSLEIFPESLRALQKRIFKYIMADWEIILSSYFKLFTKCKIAFHRKIDLLLREIRFPLGTIYIFSLLVLIIFSLFHKLSFLNEEKINVEMGLFLVLFALNPIYPTLYGTSNKLSYRIRAFLNEFGTAFSVVPLHFSATISFFIHKKGIFWPTNDKNAIKNIYGPDGTITSLIDIIIGSILITYGILNMEIICIAIGFAPIIRMGYIKLLKKFDDWFWLLGFLIFSSIIFQFLIFGNIGIVSILLLLSFVFLIY